MLQVTSLFLTLYALKVTLFIGSTGKLFSITDSCLPRQSKKEYLKRDAFKDAFISTNYKSSHDEVHEPQLKQPCNRPMFTLSCVYNFILKHCCDWLE